MFLPKAVLLTCLLHLAGANNAPTYTKPCSDHVIALATGIHLNIQGQYAEYNATAKLLSLAKAKPFDVKAYKVAQGELISDIQAGMNLRQFNQQIAPKGNAALPGLAKYQAAQQPEAAIARDLTADPKKDIPNLETLENDIKQGIKLNGMNLKNATQDCDFALQFPPANESA